MDMHGKGKIEMSLGGNAAAIYYKTTSLVVFLRSQIIYMEKKIKSKANTLENVTSSLNTLEKAASSSKPMPVWRNKVWIVEQDGKILSLQAAMLQR